MNTTKILTKTALKVHIIPFRMVITKESKQQTLARIQEVENPYVLEARM